MRPRVAAIVVSYRTGPRLKECLYALAADPDIHEVVLIDNGNPVESVAWMAAFCEGRSGYQFVTGQGNIGFGAGINLGYKRTDSEHLLVINPDAVLRWQSVRIMQETASGLKTPWIVGGRMFDLRGREVRGCRRRSLTLPRALLNFFGINRWTLEHERAPEGPVPMDVISGGFFLTSRESFDALNGFDEGYFIHVEDVDLCQRCRDAGGQVIYEPRAGALHYSSTSEVTSAFVAKQKARSLVRYFKTHARGPVERVLAYALGPVIHIATRWRRR